MHIGEFKEYGFEYEVRLRVVARQEDEGCLIDRFLSEVIEARNLAFGGNVTNGFVAANGKGSVVEEDRAAVEEWLCANLAVETVTVSPLKDAWYLEG